MQPYSSHVQRALQALHSWGPAPDDLLRDLVYRRLFTSVLLSGLGAQVTMLALPLTAALLLNATPMQMGLLTAMETLPFALLSLPAGVWLDRIRKLPVYVVGELTIALAVLSVPLAWWLGVLTMPLLYGVGFAIGAVNTFAGSAAQVVLTQVVPRQRLVAAHARNALANAGAEVAGPGLAGVLIKWLGAPVALLVDALMLIASALILRGLKVRENLVKAPQRHFWDELRVGLRFVVQHRLLVAMAITVGIWQFCHHAAQVVQILLATRSLGLSEPAIGLAYMGMGFGAILSSTLGDRLSHRFGPGPTMVMGFAACGLAWSLPAWAPAGAWGVAAFVLMLLLSGVGGVLVFINFLALRQAVTPERLLGRMTASMRWLILLPGVPGALLGGWVGENLGLRATLGGAGAVALLMAAAAWHWPVIRQVRVLPSASD